MIERSIIESVILNKTYSDIREYELPFWKLPLIYERNIFKGLSDESLNVLINNAFSNTYKVWIYSESIRNIFWIEDKKYEDVKIFEIHIDFAEIDNNIQGDLIWLGFELDSFFKFYPTIYPYHYTLKYEVPIKIDSKEIEWRLNNIYDKLFILVEQYNLLSYMEYEKYSSKIRRKFNFIEVSDVWLVKFPFNIKVEKKYLSDKYNNINKIADIHIKTPTPICWEGFSLSHNYREEKLRDKLKEFWFYEIITWAWNRIYTGQFIDMKLAIDIYEEFLKYFEQYWWIREITMENVVKMDRFQDKEWNFSEVPYILELV